MTGTPRRRVIDPGSVEYTAWRMVESFIPRYIYRSEATAAVAAARDASWNAGFDAAFRMLVQQGIITPKEYLDVRPQSQDHGELDRDLRRNGA